MTLHEIMASKLSNYQYQYQYDNRTRTEKQNCTINSKHTAQRAQYLRLICTTFHGSIGTSTIVYSTNLLLLLGKA